MPRRIILLTGFFALSLVFATACSDDGGSSNRSDDDVGIEDSGGNDVADDDVADNDTDTGDEVVEEIDEAELGLSTGRNRTCVLVDGGTVYCFGEEIWMSGSGAVGPLEAEPAPYKIPVIDDAVQISTGNGHSCVVRSDATVACWGRNDYGQLGRGGETTIFENEPQEVQGLSDVVDVSAGASFTCAVKSDGTAACWGVNVGGQLGEGSEEEYEATPVDVPGIAGAVSVEASLTHICFLYDDGTVSCWGENDAGQLGNGETEYESAPVQVTGVDDVIDLNLGDEHACAVRSDGTIVCWGDNSYRQLSGEYEANVVEVETIDDAVAVNAAYRHSCALHRDRTISCWGNSGDGQLGNGQTTGASWVETPAKLLDIDDAVAVSAGGMGAWSASHTCIKHADGRFSCVGSNVNGQLGIGEFTDIEYGLSEVSFPE